MEISKRERIGLTGTFIVVATCIAIGLCVRFYNRGGEAQRDIMPKMQVEVVDSGDASESDAFVPYHKSKTHKKKGKGRKKSASKSNSKESKSKEAPRKILRDTIHMR